MDVTKLCRGCMKEVASWEKENFYSRAVEMFSFCTNIRITEEDNLPKQFCYDCIIKIESSYTFITEAQKVNVTLKNIISRKTSVIVELETVHKNQINLDLNSIKLTLPDYKICSVIESSRQNIVNKPIQNHEKNMKPDDRNLELPLYSIEDVKTDNSEQNVIDDSNMIKCTQCSKSFKSKTWYLKHLDKDHDGKKYVCSHCHKCFSRLSQLSAHVSSHSEDRRFSCAVCDKKFKHRANLIDHSRAHSVNRPYACKLCGATFKKKGVLKSHQAVHEGGKLFLCSFCGRQFAQEGNLKVHLRLHSGDKPYPCTECTFRAVTASNLRRHRRTHSQEKPHVCTTCGKRFADGSNLSRHRRGHTGEAPYVCGECPAQFVDSWKRTVHLMRVHNHTLQDVPRVTPNKRTLLSELVASGPVLEQDSNLQTIPCETRPSYNMDHVDEQDERMSGGSAESPATSSSSGDSSDEDEQYLCSFCRQSFDYENNLRLHLCVAPYDRNITSAYTPAAASNSASIATASASAPASNSNQPASSAVAPASMAVGDSSQVAGTSNVDQQTTQSVQWEYLCTTCGKGFTDASTLADHQGAHVPGAAARPAVTPYKCSLCPDQFSERRLLLQHLLYNHQVSQVDCLRKPAKLWFKPIGRRRQMRVGGGHPNSELNGIYGIFEGMVTGFTTDRLPIGPVLTRIAHNVNHCDFTERDFWDTMRNDIMPAYNSMPGIRMFLTRSRRSTLDNNNNRPAHE